MARNRKRAKERRSRRPDSDSRPGVATARAERDRSEIERNGHVDESFEPTPGALEHATPDVELADAQLARGRAELGRDAEEEFGDDEFGEELTDAAQGGSSGGRSDGGVGTGGDGGGGSGTPPGDELAPAASAAATKRPHAGSRLITFLQGSWRELQRVQWPDRRAVMQATGVVIGFVIVAGVYLGLADTVAGKLVNLILK